MFPKMQYCSIPPEIKVTIMLQLNDKDMRAFLCVNRQNFLLGSEGFPAFCQLRKMKPPTDCHTIQSYFTQQTTAQRIRKFCTDFQIILPSSEVVAEKFKSFYKSVFNDAPKKMLSNFYALLHLPEVIFNRKNFVVLEHHPRKCCGAMYCGVGIRETSTRCCFLKFHNTDSETPMLLNIMDHYKELAPMAVVRPVSRSLTNMNSAFFAVNSDEFAIFWVLVENNLVVNLKPAWNTVGDTMTVQPL